MIPVPWWLLVLYGPACMFLGVYVYRLGRNSNHP
jgi:hypothetical protein